MLGCIVIWQLTDSLRLWMLRDGTRQQHSDAHLQPGAAPARKLLLPGEELRMSLPLPAGQLVRLSGQSTVIFSANASILTIALK